MPDVMTPQQRHDCMSHIRSKNTKPEQLVRRALWHLGFRYRLHVKDLSGKPDIVLPKYKAVIFINGCFWHGHDGCKYSVLPKTNTEFWENKIQRNKERDIREQKELAAMGWHCITIWECQLKPVIREQTLESLAYTLNHIYLNDRSVKLYEIQEDNQLLAAESDCDYMKENLK